MFRRLVVIGLVVSLGSLGLGCGTSYPKYDDAYGYECDLPDAPSEKLYVRGVYTETHSEILGRRGYAHREFRWSDPNADVDRRISAAEWTRFEMDDDSAFEACQQRYLDKAATKATPTTKPKPRPKPTTTKASSGGSEEYYERLAKCYFEEQRPGYDFAGGGERDDAAMIVCLGRVKE